MLRISLIAVAALFLSGTFMPVSAQTASGAAPATTAKPKLSRARLAEMRASWTKNKPKLAACRKEVKAKGLAGDDRWFYMQDCMNKS